MTRRVFFSIVSCLLFGALAGCMHGVAAQKQAGIDAPAIQSICVKLTPNAEQGKATIPGGHEISCPDMLGSPWSNVLNGKIGKLVQAPFASASVPMPTDLKVLWVDRASAKITRQQLTRIARKLGVAAVVERVGNTWQLYPLTKMVQRLTMEPLPVEDLGTSPAKAIAAAVLAHLSDDAFYNADFAGSCVMAQSAIKSVADKGYGCGFDAPLLYLAWKSARRGGCDEDYIFKLLRSDCLDARHDAWTQSEEDFFKVLTELESIRSSRWTKENLPSACNSAQGRKQYLDRLRSVARKFSGPRGRLINTLADELEAFTISPSGPCDHETPQRRAEKLASSAKRLFMLGRADLSSYVPGMATSGEQAPDPDGIMLWQKMVAAPDMAWLRMEKLLSLLWKLYLDPGFWQNSGMAAGVCKAYQGEILRRVEQDRWPEHSKRALDLLSGASVAFSMCSDTGSLDGEFQKVLDEIQSARGGRFRVLLSVGAFLPQIFTSIITGSGASGSLAELKSVVQGRLKKLGDAPEDRALGACLKTFLVIEPALKKNFLSVTGTLQELENELYQLPYPPPAKAAAILRVAPGCHLALGYLLAITHGLMGKRAESEDLLSRLEPRMESSITLLMDQLGAQSHAPQAISLVAAVHSIVRLAFASDEQNKTDLDKALLAMKNAWRPLGKTGGWWNIGLSSLDIVLADTMALLWKDKLGRDKGTKLMRWSGERLGELVQAAMSWFSLRGPSYDMFLLVQPIHRGLVEYFSLGEVPFRTQKTLLASWAGIVPVLEKLSASRTPDARMKNLLERGSITDLVMEFFWNIRDLGFEKIMSGDDRAVNSLLARAEKLDEDLKAGGRKQLVFLMEASIASLLKIAKKSDLAHDWLKRASANSKKEGFGVDTIPYLQALDSSAWADGNDITKARVVLRHAMEPAFQAKKCKSYHPSMALYLPLAYLAERDGAHELAMAQLDEYLQLIDGGFSGEGKIQCKYSFNSGNALVQMTLDVALSNVFQSTTTEQSWQVGLGAQSKSMKDEKLVCTDSPIEYRRYDRVLLAHGLEAFYSLMHGDDISADLHLRQMRQDLDIINNGNSLTLNRFESDGLEFAKTNLYSPLLFWTGLLAQLRGHTIDGEAIEGMALRLMGGTEEERMQDMGLSPGRLPSYLQGMPDLAKMQPFFARWFKVSGKSDSLDSETIALLNRLHRALPHVVPKDAKDLLQVAKYTGAGEMEKARHHLKSFKASSRPLQARDKLFDAALAFVSNGKLLDVKELTRLVRKSVTGGYSSDALKMLNVLQDPVLKRDGEKAAVALIQAANPKVPDDRNTLVSQLMLVSVYEVSGNKAGQFNAIENALAHCKGLLSAEPYFTLQYKAMMLALSLGMYEKAHTRLSSQLPVFRSVYGDREIVVGMLVMELSLRMLLKQDWDRAELEQLIAWLDSTAMGKGRYAQFVRNALEAINEKKEIAPLCKKFLADEASIVTGS